MIRSDFIVAVAKKLFRRTMSPEYVRLSMERELKTMEGEIGARIFGPLEPNERRAFFNDSKSSWFFYQEKTDELKNIHSVTLHYEVRPEGILRVVNRDGMKCEYIHGQELDNFLAATEIYYDNVMRQIYGKSNRSGNQLAA